MANETAYVPRRPRVVRMRDLSPATRALLTREYYDAYDPWTGARIAATLGVFISLFALFLVYKSRFHRSRNALLPTKKTSLYLFDDETARSPSDSLAYSFVCNRPPPFQLEEVCVKGSVVERVALKVHPSSNKDGPKYGTLCITEDTNLSLPCTPRKPPFDGAAEALPPVQSDSLTDSIASFGSSLDERDVMPKVAEKNLNQIECDDEEVRPKSLMVTAKKPQDYRSRSTVVAIARRKRPP